MGIEPPSIESQRKSLAAAVNPEQAIVSLTVAALELANSSVNYNTYLWRDEQWTIEEARRIAAVPKGTSIEFADGRPALWGIPVSLKDCFDLAAAPTSCGTHFYRDLNGIAANDSWLAMRLRESGAVITGKTHLHPLAYGITGENAEFGDSLQPNNPSALTGGSSSGAAASILEGSAMAAIGTDTGGSIRVPAALCGLAGYRASIGRGSWYGAAHLAPSFDTMGWLYRHLEDGPLLGPFFGSTFGPEQQALTKLPQTFAIIDQSFLQDCEPQVIASYKQCQAELQRLGLTSTTINVSWWVDSTEIFAAIQASEAAIIHQGHFARFEPSIRQRLEWGGSLSSLDLVSLRARHDTFRRRMDDLLIQHQLLLLPAAPTTRLAARADHSQTRTRLLRYTTPISLAGMPAVTIPFILKGQPSGGMQLVAAREQDAPLLALTAELGRQRKIDLLAPFANEVSEL